MSIYMYSMYAVHTQATWLPRFTELLAELLAGLLALPARTMAEPWALWPRWKSATRLTLHRNSLRMKK